MRQLKKGMILLAIMILQCLLVGYDFEDNNMLEDENIVTQDIILEQEEKHSGWYQDEESDWFYYDQDGVMLTGWHYINGDWYYLDADNQNKPGIMIKESKKEIQGSYYFFDESGAMRTGWLRCQEGWYYADNNGAMHTGWAFLDNEWYYLDGNNEQYPGLMVANCYKEIQGVEYLFRTSGVMYRGWLKIEEDWYYYNTSGVLCSGWQFVGNEWYYLDAEDNNKMVNSGWMEIDEQWYFFSTSGVMYRNWLQRPEGWYYMGADGAMKTGWHTIDGRWYYFYFKDDSHGGSEGLMAHSCSIDGWFLSTSGAMVTAEEQNMTIRAQQYASNTMYMLMVDLNNCRVGVFRGSQGNWSLMYYWLCSPGKASTPTVKGQFTVGSKGYYFDSGASRCFWYTQFYNDYLFHSVLYNKNGTLQDGRLGMHLSHGCVRMEISNAKWIYDNIPRGTKVVIY